MKKSMMNDRMPLIFLQQKQCFSSLVASVLLLSLNVFSIQQAHAQVVLDKIAAVVNNDVILQSQLDERIETLRKQFSASQEQLPPDEILRKELLDRMIIEKLQLASAHNAGITIEPQFINEAMRNMAEKNGMTPPDFIAKLEQEDIDFISFRENLKTELLINKVQQSQVASRITISEKDIQRYKQSHPKLDSNHYHLGHILLSFDEGDAQKEAQARDKAEQIKDSPEDFALLAQRYSQASTAPSGGDLGWRKTQDIPGIFQQAVQNLSVGELALIETAGSLHIVKLLDKKTTEKDTKEALVTQHKVRHILLKTKPEQSEAGKNRVKIRLEKIRQAIIEGKDFADLARQESDDLGSAIKGGELGWVMNGQMVPEFEQYMNQQTVGEVSPVFQTAYGWHILQVQERREHNMAETVGDVEIRQAIYQQRYQESLQMWLRQLRSRAYVDIK